MAVPDFQSLMLPLLKYAAENDRISTIDARNHLAKVFDLTKEDIEKKLPKSGHSVFVNRVAWALVYLKKAGLISSPERAIYKITETGLKEIDSKPDSLDQNYLKNKYGKRDFSNSDTSENNKFATTTDKTPLELITEAYYDIRQKLIGELLDSIKNSSPEFFEKLVVELLVKMGYGGSFEDAAEVIGKSGDEGIDGIIKEDKLGLDTIYIQAKKWENQVSRPEIQKFAGALMGKKAIKGVFITTSGFSKHAMDYAENLENKIVLIDGEKLANYMIDHNLGVSEEVVYEIKKIDMDYFSGE